MRGKSASANKTTQKKSGLFSLLKPYRGMILLLIFFALLSNGINLVLPRIIANGIDAYPSHYVLKTILFEFLSGRRDHFYFYFPAKHHSDLYLGKSGKGSPFPAGVKDLHAEIMPILNNPILQNY